MNQDRASSRTLLWRYGGIALLGWAAVSTPSWAVDPLELDTNTVDAAAGLPDDWNTLIGGGGGAGSFSGVTADGSAANSGALSGPGDKRFTSGSKNINDVSTWEATDKGQNPPNKDDLLAIMSAEYKANNRNYLYFAAIRAGADADSESNGTATLGFWFLQTATSIGSDNKFIGGHQVGDLLLTTTFKKGGGEVSIIAQTWTGSGLSNPVNYTCTANGDVPCGIVNSGIITIPQELNVKGGTWPGFANNSVPASQFFEGGVNLDDIYPNGIPCFNSFLAETVSSNPNKPALKDFVLGKFGTCSVAVSKACGGGVANLETETVKYDVAGIVTNTGTGQVNNFVITDAPSFDANSLTCHSVTGDPASGSYADIVAKLGGTISCTSTVNGGGRIGYKAKVTTTNGASDTVTAAASGVGGGTVTPGSASATCPVIKSNPNILATKKCDAFLVRNGTAGLTYEVDYEIQVCNTGATILNNVNVSDPKAGLTYGPVTLAPNACVKGTDGQNGLRGTYKPLNWGVCSTTSSKECASDSDCPGSETCGVSPNESFSNVVTATGETSATFANVVAPTCVLNQAGTTVICTSQDTAECPYCPPTARPRP